MKVGRVAEIHRYPVKSMLGERIDSVAVGLDAIFVEVHPQPDAAPCDGPSQLGYRDFERLLTEVRAIDRAVGQGRSARRAG